MSARCDDALGIPAEDGGVGRTGFTFCLCNWRSCSTCSIVSIGSDICSGLPRNGIEGSIPDRFGSSDVLPEETQAQIQWQLVPDGLQRHAGVVSAQAIVVMGLSG